MAQYLTDLLALEAGEYLDQLEHLLTRETEPRPDEILRLARGVRGSARVAQVQGVARVAEQLERMARALEQKELEWSGDLRARAVRTVDDLRVLVRAARDWNSEAEARARASVERWNELLPRRAAPASEGQGGGEQLLPFVRAELGGIRMELGRALSEWATSLDPVAALKRVQMRMRAIRGIQGVAPLRPLLEMLETLEDTLRLLVHRGASASAGGREALSAANAMLAEAASAVENGTYPAAVGSGWEQFQRLRAEIDAPTAERDHDAVPVHTLFHDDAGPHVVSSPIAPLPGSPGEPTPAPVREFLQLEATGFLDRADALLDEIGDKSVRKIAAQLAGLAYALRDMAAAFTVQRLRVAAEAAADALAEADSPNVARAILARLRSSLTDESLSAPASAPQAAETEAVEAAPAGSKQVQRESPAETPAQGAAPPAEDDVVPVETLLLRGDQALEAASSLRPELERLLAAGDTAAARTLADELFTLIRLGMDREGPV
jgi:chemotaxis protein histidine kinase CheA